MSLKSGFESREREREPQFNTADGSEFQVRGAAVLNDLLYWYTYSRIALKHMKTTTVYNTYLPGNEEN